MGIVPVVGADGLGDPATQLPIARTVHAVMASAAELTLSAIRMVLVDVRILVHDPFRWSGRGGAEQRVHPVSAECLHCMIQPGEIKLSFLFFHPDPGKLSHADEIHSRLTHQHGICFDPLWGDMFGVIGGAKLKVHRGIAFMK